MKRWRFPQYIPIQAKLFLCLLLTIIIPLLFIIPILQNYQSEANEAELRSINQERSDQTVEQMDMIYEQINAVSNLYFLDAEIESILRTGVIYDYRQLALDNQKIVRLQERYDKTLPKVNLHVTIISNDNRIYGDSSYDTMNVPLSAKERQWWYRQLQKTPWQTLWIQDNYLDQLHGVSGGRYIYSVRFLKRFDNWENHGILIVSFLESDLVKLYANTVPAAGSVFILNRNGSLVSQIDNAGVASSQMLLTLPDDYSAVYKREIGGKDYQIVTNTVRNPLWRLVYVTPDQQAQIRYETAGLLPVTTALFVIMVAVFSAVCSHYIIKPIERLTKSVQQVGQGGVLSQELAVQSRDEVGILATEFDNMLARVEGLLEEMMDEQKAKRDAELQALYAQINPHFIYNTLASIRFLVLSGDTDRADSALSDFIALLRSSISTKEELCMIRDEVSLLKRYLHIQELFFEEPFHVEWDVAPDTLSCKIIRLTLQPIVENAILHGLKSKKGEKRLTIRIASQGDAIRISIADNGVGTDKAPDFDRVSNEYSGSIGLRNVNSRIVLHFGKPYGLRFSSRPGEGTTVEMVIPRIESQKEIM